MAIKKYDCIVIGGGLSGLFSAYLIASLGNVSVGLFEKGPEMKKRHLDVPGDHLSGIGGAGTLSGGKLCKYPSSGQIWELTGNDLSTWNLFIDQLPLSQIHKEKLYSYDMQTPFLSKIERGLTHKRYTSIPLLKDQMREFIKGICSLNDLVGIETHTDYELIEIDRKSNTYTLSFRNGNENITATASTVIVATGRTSAGSLDKILSSTKVSVFEQAPDLGVRIQVPKGSSGHFQNLGQDTKIKTKIGSIGMRTFCVCTGGGAVNVSLNGTKYSDGHFENDFTTHCNFGIMARSPKLVGYDAAIKYCKAIDPFAGEMSVAEFLKAKDRILLPKHRLQYHDIIDSVGGFIDILNNNGIISGNLSEHKIIMPSIDRYWPKPVVDSSFETASPNLYIVGDAAGISRGYLQSLWSGWCCGCHIVSKITNTPKYSWSDDVRRLYAA